MQAKTIQIQNLIQKTSKNHLGGNGHKSLLIPMSFGNLLQNLNAFALHSQKSALINKIESKINFTHSLQSKLLRPISGKSQKSGLSYSGIILNTNKITTLSKSNKAITQELSSSKLDSHTLQTLNNLQKIIKNVVGQSIASGKPIKITIKTDSSDNFQIELDSTKKSLQIQVDDESLKRMPLFSKVAQTQYQIENNSVVVNQAIEESPKSSKSSVTKSQPKAAKIYEILNISNSQTLPSLFKIIEDVTRSFLATKKHRNNTPDSKQIKSSGDLLVELKNNKQKVIVDLGKENLDKTGWSQNRLQALGIKNVKSIGIQIENRKSETQNEKSFSSPIKNAGLHTQKHKVLGSNAQGTLNSDSSDKAAKKQSTAVNVSSSKAQNHKVLSSNAQGTLNSDSSDKAAKKQSTAVNVSSSKAQKHKVLGSNVQGTLNSDSSGKTAKKQNTAANVSSSKAQNHKVQDTNVHGNLKSSSTDKVTKTPSSAINNESSHTQRHKNQSANDHVNLNSGLLNKINTQEDKFGLTPDIEKEPSTKKNKEILHKVESSRDLKGVNSNNKQKHTIISKILEHVGSSKSKISKSDEFKDENGEASKKLINQSKHKASPELSAEIRNEEKTQKSYSSKELLASNKIFRQSHFTSENHPVEPRSHETEKTTQKNPESQLNRKTAPDLSKVDLFEKAVLSGSATKIKFTEENTKNQIIQRSRSLNVNTPTITSTVDSGQNRNDSTDQISENKNNIYAENNSKNHHSHKTSETLASKETSKFEVHKATNPEYFAAKNKTSRSSPFTRNSNSIEPLDHKIIESKEEKPVAPKSTKSSPGLINNSLHKKDSQEKTVNSSNIVVDKSNYHSAKKVSKSNSKAETVELFNNLESKSNTKINNRAEHTKEVAYEEKGIHQSDDKTHQKLSQSDGLSNSSKFIIQQHSANNSKLNSLNNVNELNTSSVHEKTNNKEDLIKPNFKTATTHQVVETLNKAFSSQESSSVHSSNKQSSSWDSELNAHSDLENSSESSHEDFDQKESQLQSSINTNNIDWLSDNLKLNKNVNFNSLVSLNQLAGLSGNKTSGTPTVQRSLLPAMLQKILENANSRLTMSGQKLEVLLDVESLGTLTVDAVRHKDKIHLKINVENNEARHWLENHIRPLIEQINKAGIEVDKFEVSVGNQKLEQQQQRKEDPNLPSFRKAANIQKIKETRNNNLNQNGIPPGMLKRNFGYNTVEVWI